MQIQQSETNPVLFQTNALINARYHLTLDERKLILMALSQLMATTTPTIEEIAQCQFFDIDVKKLYELSEEKIEYKKFAQRMRKSVRTLFDRKIVLDAENATVWIRWITQIKWDLNQYVIQIKLSNEVMPLLVGIKDEFTAYKLKNVIKLRKTESIRLYELLQQYEEFRERTFPLEELRALLDPNDIQKRTDYFNARLLKPVIADVNENTNMRIDEPEFISQGRKITAIKFKFMFRKGTKNTDNLRTK